MYQHLTSEQRYGIFSLLATNSKLSFIAETLNVSVSTISREIKRNSWREKYHPKAAQELADGRKKRLSNNHCIKPDVKKRILHYLTEEQWSPKQISGYLKREGINVSHEYIYQIIRADKERYALYPLAAQRKTQETPCRQMSADTRQNQHSRAPKGSRRKTFGGF